MLAFQRLQNEKLGAWRILAGGDSNGDSNRISCAEKEACWKPFNSFKNVKTNMAAQSWVLKLQSLI